MPANEPSSGKSRMKILLRSSVFAAIFLLCLSCGRLCGGGPCGQCSAPTGPEVRPPTPPLPDPSRAAIEKQVDMSERKESEKKSDGKSAAKDPAADQQQKTDGGNGDGKGGVPPLPGDVPPDSPEQIMLSPACVETAADVPYFRIDHAMLAYIADEMIKEWIKTRPPTHFPFISDVDVGDREFTPPSDALPVQIMHRF